MKPTRMLALVVLILGVAAAGTCAERRADGSVASAGDDNAAARDAQSSRNRQRAAARLDLPAPIIYIGRGFSDGLGWKDGFKTGWRTQPRQWLMARVSQYAQKGVRSFLLDCAYLQGNKVSGYQYSLLSPEQREAISTACRWLEENYPGEWRFGVYMGVWFDSERVSLRTDPHLSPGSLAWQQAMMGEIEGFASLGCNFVGLDNAASPKVINFVLALLPRIRAAGVLPIGEAIPLSRPDAMTAMHWFGTINLLDRDWADPDRTRRFPADAKVYVGLHGWTSITGEDRESFKRRGYDGFVIYDHGRGEDPLPAHAIQGRPR